MTPNRAMQYPNFCKLPLAEVETVQKMNLNHTPEKAHKLANTDVKGYYIHMNKKRTSMIIRSYALDKQLLELLVKNAKSNERNLSSELRYRLRQAYGLIPSQEAVQA